MMTMCNQRVMDMVAKATVKVVTAMVDTDKEDTAKEGTAKEGTVKVGMAMEDMVAKVDTVARADILAEVGMARVDTAVMDTEGMVKVAMAVMDTADTVATTHLRKQRSRTN